LCGDIAADCNGFAGGNKRNAAPAETGSG